MADHMLRSEQEQRNRTMIEGEQAARVGSDEAGVHTAIIWTPRFLLLFALVLALGLSLGSLLTQGWLNGYYAAEWVLCGYTVILFVLWLAIVLRTSNTLLRVGAIFGGIWALGMGSLLLIRLLVPVPNEMSMAHLTTATACALLGAYLCLSCARTRQSKWDRWFLWLAPLVGGGVVALIFFLEPVAARSALSLENTLAKVVLLLCVVVWWLRPSCWKAQPGPTLLLGLFPAMLLLFMGQGHITSETAFFFSQVAFLVLLLAILRILRCELPH